nr:MalY/PatB family protein [uncultured Fusobacterium sp.]
MDKKEFLKKYLVNRKNTNSLKWDDLKNRYGDDNLISMWVADMEFKTEDRILEAMKERIDHGVFGYSLIPEDYFITYSNWSTKHYNLPLKKEWIRFCTGVVTAISWTLNTYTNIGDSCLILTPVYYPFHDVITVNKRNLVTVDLKNNNGYFEIDYEAVERAIIKNKVKLFVQCSPHNPVGRVWKEEELEKLFEICSRYNVLILSDEIHQDIILGNNKFVTAANVTNGKYRDNLILISSASKTFNLAGLLHSHIIIFNENLRKIYDEYAKKINRTEVNILGTVATQAGYQFGEEWLKNILEIINDNYNYLKNELHKKAPKIIVSSLEGTYLVLLDLREYIPSNKTKEFIQDKCKLAVDFGEWFGENYKGFVRLNLATDPNLVIKATQNIIKELKLIKN